MRSFNRELAVAKLNVLKTQRDNIQTRYTALVEEVSSVETKLEAKDKVIAELETKLQETEVKVA